MPDRIVDLYRKRIAGETGTVKKDWGGRLAVALIYPNLYRVGMSNLGFQVLYRLFNERGDVVAERAFLPEDKELSLHLAAGKDLLSLESQIPLVRFDILAFSLSFENDYPNILKILDLSKIPLLSADRHKGHPLVMGGGITTFLNPEPLADVFDLFLIGEAEGSLHAFIELFKDIAGTHPGRQELLLELAKGNPSVYIPSLYHLEYHKDGTIKSRVPVDNGVPLTIKTARAELKDYPVNRSTLLTSEAEFADRVLIELGRGCGRSCRFCAAGYVYRPPRIHDKDSLIACAGDAIGSFGRAGLLSPSVLDTPGIGDITGMIAGAGGSFSLSSLRADLLTSEILEHLKKAGQKTVAIAPETGSERLRKVINKHLTNEQITRAVRLIAKAGDFSLRLYFIMGLPTETREDSAAILELVKSIKHHMIKESKERGRIGSIRLSVNCFIPKAFTPFQWFPMENVTLLKEKQKWLRRAFEKEGGVKASFDVPKWAYIQALLSLGDRRVGSVLMLAHKFRGDWSRAFRHSKINPEFFVYRPKGLDEILPWDFIDHGIRKEYLIGEYRLALKGKESDICRVGECDRCGVCESPR